MVSQFALYCCFKYHGQEHLGEERSYLAYTFMLQFCLNRSWGRNRSSGRGETLLTSLLSSRLALDHSFQGWQCPQMSFPIHQQLRKYPIDLLTVGHSVRNVFLLRFPLLKWFQFVLSRETNKTKTKAKKTKQNKNLQKSNQHRWFIDFYIIKASLSWGDGLVSNVLAI